MSGKKVPVFTTGNVNKPSVPYIPTGNVTCVNACNGKYNRYDTTIAIKIINPRKYF